MRLVIEVNPDGVAKHAARSIAKQINTFNPSPSRYYVLGLPTGSTPLGTYKNLIEYCKRGELSFKYVKTFNIDECCAIPRDHPESHHLFMWNNLFKHIDIPADNVNRLDGNSADLEKECQRYEKKITEAGRIDLFVGGVGSDRHIAFNEPGSGLVSRTRINTLIQSALEFNKRYPNKLSL